MNQLELTEKTKLTINWSTIVAVVAMTAFTVASYFEVKANIWIIEHDITVISNQIKEHKHE